MRTEDRNENGELRNSVVELCLRMKYLKIGKFARIRSVKMRTRVK